MGWLQLKLKEYINSHLVSVFVKRSFYLEIVRQIEKNLLHESTELEHLILDKQPSLGFLKHSINPPSRFFFLTLLKQESKNTCNMKASFFCTPLCSSNLTNVRKLICLKFRPSSFSPYLLSKQVKISSGGLLVWSGVQDGARGLWCLSLESMFLPSPSMTDLFKGGSFQVK